MSTRRPNVIKMDSILRANENMLNGKKPFEGSNLPEALKRKILARQYSVEEINEGYTRAVASMGQ